MSSGSLRDRLREATTREILDAAETVLAEQGIASASMASIAQKAGVSVGTLYNYFKDKDQLLATILSVRRGEFAAHLDVVAKEQEKAAFGPHLEALVRAVFILFDQYSKFLRIVIEHSGTEKKRKLWLLDRVTPVMAKGAAEGRFDQASVATFAALVAGAIGGALQLRLEQPEGAASIEVDAVVAFLLGRFGLGQK
jgi:AcrR family transcriptional regulator